MSTTVIGGSYMGLFKTGLMSFRLKISINRNISPISAASFSSPPLFEMPRQQRQTRSAIRRTGAIINPMARPEANAGLNVPGCPIPVQEILSNGFFKTYFEAIGEAYHALVLRSVYLAALAAKRQGGDFLEVARNTLRLKMVMLGQINQDYRPEMSNALRRELIEGSISEERRAETERFKIQQ